jgi:hypothetical protein
MAARRDRIGLSASGLERWYRSERAAQIRAPIEGRRCSQIRAARSMGNPTLGPTRLSKIDRDIPARDVAQSSTGAAMSFDEGDRATRRRQAKRSNG